MCEEVIWSCCECADEAFAALGIQTDPAAGAIGQGSRHIEAQAGKDRFCLPPNVGLRWGSLGRRLCQWRQQCLPCRSIIRCELDECKGTIVGSPQFVAADIFLDNLRVDSACGHRAILGEHGTDDAHSLPWVADDFKIGNVTWAA